MQIVLVILNLAGLGALFYLHLAIKELKVQISNNKPQKQPHPSTAVLKSIRGNGDYMAKIMKTWKIK